MLRIHRLGNLRVFHDGVAVKFAAPPKTAPRWAYLLLHRGDPFLQIPSHREVLAAYERGEWPASPSQP